jgi:hypothetical protein
MTGKKALSCQFEIFCHEQKAMSRKFKEILIMGAGTSLAGRPFTIISSG